MVQFLPFWDDVTISFLAFSLLKQQEQTKKCDAFIYYLLSDIVAAGENGNDLNYYGLYLNKSVMVIIIKIYDRGRFL
jgi:hypothetical protein